MIKPLESLLAHRGKHVLLENESMIGDERLHVVSIKRTPKKYRRVASATSKLLSKIKLKSVILAKNLSIFGRRMISEWNHWRQQQRETNKELSIKNSSLDLKSMTENNEEKIPIPGKDSSESYTSTCSQRLARVNSILAVEPRIETSTHTRDGVSQQAMSEVESLGDCTGWNSYDGFDATQYIAEPPIFFDDTETLTLEGATVASGVVVVDGQTMNPPHTITDNNRENVCTASRGTESTCTLSTATANKDKEIDDSTHCSPCQTFVGSGYFLGFQCSIQGSQGALSTDNDMILSSTTWYQDMVEVVLGRQKTCIHCLDLVSEKEAVVQVYTCHDEEIQQHLFHSTCIEERRQLAIQKDKMLKEFEEFCSLLRAHKKQKRFAKTFEGAAMIGPAPSSNIGHFELVRMKHFVSKLSFMRVGRRK